MFNKDQFYKLLRGGKLLGPNLVQSEIDGIEAILNEGLARKWSASWLAYALATAYHETAHTMKPCQELGGEKYLTRMYDIKGNRPTMAKTNGNIHPGDGIKYCGRGFVQLTWKNNYEKAEKKLGIVGLVDNPNLIMHDDVAAKVLGSGMEEGWFTGKSLKNYLPQPHATHDQFSSARRIINGTDRADLIADYAMTFQADLVASGV